MFVCVCVCLFPLSAEPRGHSGARRINKWCNQSTVHLVEKWRSLLFSPKWILLLCPFSEASVLEHEISNAAGEERRGKCTVIMMCRKLEKERSDASAILLWTSTEEWLCQTAITSFRHPSNSNKPTKPAIIQSSSHTTPSWRGKCSGSDWHCHGVIYFANLLA